MFNLNAVAGLAHGEPDLAPHADHPVRFKGSLPGLRLWCYVGLVAFVLGGCNSADESRRSTLDGGGHDAGTTPVMSTTQNIPDGSTPASVQDSSLSSTPDATVNISPIDAAFSDPTSPVDAAIIPDAPTQSCSLNEACCPNETCQSGYTCQGERCGCIQALAGDTYLRSDGTVMHPVSPKPIERETSGEALTGVQQVFEGHWHGCARREDGTVWCWAKSNRQNSNGAGQLGNGSTTPPAASWQATQVLTAKGTPLTDVKAINAASSRCYLASSMCAIRTDGTLWCWGAGNNGGGGNIHNNAPGSSPSYRVFATQVFASSGVGLTDVEAVSVGRRHACVLRGGGEVWCWGANIGGPLGQGNQDAQEYPARVTLPAPAKVVGAGSDITCALVTDSVYCWGATGSGGVGLGEPKDNTDGCINYCKLTPVPVLTTENEPLKGVTELNMAYLGACAKLEDHTLHCWGSGVGTTASLLTIQGNPVADVALYTSCGSGGVDNALRFLSRDNVLRNPAIEVQQVCD